MFDDLYINEHELLRLQQSNDRRHRKQLQKLREADSDSDDDDQELYENGETLYRYLFAINIFFSLLACIYGWYLNIFIVYLLTFIYFLYLFIIYI